MAKDFSTASELIKKCEDENKKIYQVMIERETSLSGRNEKDLIADMGESLRVMKNAVQKGLYTDVKSVGGMVGGDAKRLREHLEKGRSLCGKTVSTAVASAMAVVEVNASMGKIVAAPTAGSSGILPGVLLNVGEQFGYSDEEMTRALFTASAIGFIITRNATVAGAEGGCQAETGSAAAMAAGAIVELCGGSPSEAFHASAMTIKNILGLVCDPIAGLVEAPCVKRNALGAANALMCADMALAGIQSIIPFDEVIEAMYKVGRQLPCELRETGDGGLAATPTGKLLQEKIFGKQ